MIVKQRIINSLVEDLTSLTKDSIRFEQVHRRLILINCTLEFPLGEIANTAVGGFIWAFNLQNKLNNIQPIEKPDSFNAQGLEGKIVIEDLLITTALLFAKCGTVGRYQIKMDKKDLSKLAELLNKEN